MKISVCIPSIRAETVATAIQSIVRQTWTDWELIVIGQGAATSERTEMVKQTVLQARRTDQRIRYLHIEQKGVCRARNAGIAAAAAPVIALLDDDCEAREDWLATITDYLDRHTDVGLIGGRVVKPPKQKSAFGVCPDLDVAEALYDPVAMNGIPPAGWSWISCNVALRREVAVCVGPWDDHLGPGTEFPGADDTDYLLRLEQIGVKMLSTPNLVVYHSYGYRYGIKPMVKHLRNYAYANGGLAAKLTLMGDPRGPDWLGYALRERVSKRVWSARPDRAVRGAIGWRHFKAGYDHCLANYHVDHALLQPDAN